MFALASARLASVGQNVPIEQAKQAIEAALAMTIARYADAEVASIVQGDAAIYLAGAFQASGQAELAQEKCALGRVSYQESVNASAAQHLATALVPQLHSIVLSDHPLKNIWAYPPWLLHFDAEIDTAAAADLTGYFRRPQFFNVAARPSHRLNLRGKNTELELPK